MVLAEALEVFVRELRQTGDPEVNRLIQLYNIELPDEDF